MDIVRLRSNIAVLAEALEDIAKALSTSGIGLHATNGHVVVLRRMAASMRADGENGQTPHTFGATPNLLASAPTSRGPISSDLGFADVPKDVLQRLQAAGVDVENPVSLKMLDEAFASIEHATTAERIATKTMLARRGKLVA